LWKKQIIFREATRKNKDYRKHAMKTLTKLAEEKSELFKSVKDAAQKFIDEEEEEDED